MRTTAQEAAFQIALKYCSKEVGGKFNIYVILVKEEVYATKHTFLQRVAASLMTVTASHPGIGIPMRNFSAFLDTEMGRSKNQTHIIFS